MQLSIGFRETVLIGKLSVKLPADFAITPLRFVPSVESRIDINDIFSEF